MHGRRPVLDAVNVKARLVQFDLMPLQIADFDGSQAMAVGGQNHGRVTVTVAAVLAGTVHEPLDFALGEIATTLTACNCQVYSGWRRATGCRFHWLKFPCQLSTI